MPLFHDLVYQLFCHTNGVVCVIWVGGSYIRLMEGRSVDSVSGCAERRGFAGERCGYVPGFRAIVIE